MAVKRGAGNFGGSGYGVNGDGFDASKVRRTTSLPAHLSVMSRTKLEGLGA